jgi:RLL motif-containing protein 1
MCCRVICQLCPAGAADLHSAPSSAEALEALEALPLGFSSVDPLVGRAGRLLRLLYVDDLRRTQRLVNDTISRMQQFTADPKTDSRLGRVGH